METAQFVGDDTRALVTREKDITARTQRSVVSVSTDGLCLLNEQRQRALFRYLFGHLFGQLFFGSQCATARLCLGARGTSSKSALGRFGSRSSCKGNFFLLFSSLFAKMLHDSWNVRRMFFVLCCCTCWLIGARRITNYGDREFVRTVEDDATNPVDLCRCR